MAQIKIYARRAHLERHRQAISDAVQRAMSASLGLPEDKRFHRFFPLDDADFVYPPDRSASYTVVEVSMFEGRSDAAKRACLEALMQGVSAAMGAQIADVEVTLFETPRRNWGIRGKVADTLALSYDVDV